ncbi:hypothetical protein ACK4DQ_01205, partial [Enterococcus faecium]
MTYTHLTPNELVMIEAYFHQETPVAIVAKQLKRGRQTIYNVYNFLKCGGTALEYFEQYKENKRRCGRTEIIFPAEEKEYIAKRSTWNGNSFFDKFYKVQNFFPYAIPIVL